MAALALRRRRPAGILSDRLTQGLAAVALATAGTVVGGELLRLARRRQRAVEADSATESPSGVFESAEIALLSTSQATQDTVSVAIEGYQATPRHETVLFNLLSGFLGSFALMRLSTAGIRAGWWPYGNVRVRGRHIHHFVPGIIIAFAAGAVALFTEDESLEEALAIPFGAGVGMTVDEAALLLDLRDVYWTREGVLSVQLGLGGAALMGGTILALRMLRRGEREVEAQGAIPPPPV
jgi:hypothetical protein